MLDVDGWYQMMPDVEHRIIIAESGVEMKKPLYMRMTEK